MDFVPLQPPYENYSINKNGDLINNKKQKLLRAWYNRGGYKCFTLRNWGLNIKRNLTMHRLLGLSFIPNPNNYPCIDHIDRNVKNNNLNNLRWCSHQMNTINRICKNPLGRGIEYSRNKQRFYVNLWRNRKKKYIGVYDTIEEAKKAYKNAVEEWCEENSIENTADLD
jgi:hypothetical protein